MTSKTFIIKHCFSLLFLLVFLPLTVNASQTYYVSSSQGDDSNDGLSESKPWKTTQKIDNYSFSPGDNILFKRGDTFNYAMRITDSGEENAPIVLGSYGNGNKPIINATEGPDHYHASIRLMEIEHIVIDSLEITGNRWYGIEITKSNHVVIKNSYIHHINPTGRTHCIAGGGNWEGGGKHITIVNNEIAYCGYEAYYGNTEHIEISYNYIHHTDMFSNYGDAANNYAKCEGGGDAIQLNCWSKNYHVHHNVIDHSNTCGGKGALISSHCTLACRDGAGSDEPRCLDQTDPGRFESNGIFEHNTVIGGPNDNFGTTHSGGGDVVRYNTYYFDKGEYSTAERADFALKSERGLVFHHNTVDGYVAAISLGKDNSTFQIYNNLFTNTIYTFWGTASDTRRSDVEIKNNLFLGVCQRRSANTNQVFRYSYNISTDSFMPPSSSGGGTLMDGGNNMIIALNELFLKNPSNSQFIPLSNSPVVNAGIDVGLAFNGTSPNIGPYESIYFPWILYLPAINMSVNK